MPCELLDFRCLFVSELVGSAVLAAVLAVVLYFIIASKMRLGFDTTIAFLFPLLFIFGLAITGFSIIYAFATVVVGFLLAWVFNRVLRSV